MPEGIVQITLSANRGVALVSAEDAERVRAAGPWHVMGEGYVADRHGRYLHRFILDAPDGLLVDHRNRDKRDCRRSNLRLVTRAQNAQNKDAQSNSTTGLRGVLFDRTAKARPYRARVTVNGRHHYFGRHATAEDAAAAAAEGRRELMSHG